MTVADTEIRQTHDAAESALATLDRLEGLGREPDATESPLPEPSIDPKEARQTRRPWYWRWVDNGPALVAILFLVTGAFGLPLLYHSRAFSTRTKWIIGILNIAYTVGSCYWAYVETMRYVAIIQSALGGGS